MPVSFRVNLCVCIAALVVGCATPDPAPAPAPAPAAEPAAASRDAPAGGRAATGFPKPEALEQLEDAPVPGDLELHVRFRDVDAWSLEGPFPDRVDASAPRPGDQPLDPLLDELVRARAGLVIATVAMECYARETGRFVREHGVQPGGGLQRFIAGRCGVATAPPQVVRYWWESPRLRSVDAAMDALRGQIADRLRESVVGGPADVGAVLQVEAGRAELVVAWGERLVRIDPVATDTTREGRVTLSGELLRPAAAVQALVTRGPLGWAECDARDGVALPRFQLDCAVDTADPHTRISVLFVAPGSILSEPALELLVRPGGDPLRDYRRHRYVSPRTIDGDAELAVAFRDLLNEVRGRAGAAPLVLEVAQSEVAAELAPQYFAALRDPARRPMAQLVALGMMAGWEVEAIVQEGRFTFGWLVESRDVGSLISDTLDHPGARVVLLDPELERLAVGAVSGGDADVAYVAVIAATYRLFSESQHRENATRIHDRLSRARSARSRAAPRPLVEVQPLAVAAASRVQAGEMPEAVLGELIQQSVDTLGRSVTGWFGETQDLDALVFPEEFLERRELDLAIAVAFHKPRGEPWGRYLVLMVAAEPDRRGT